MNSSPGRALRLLQFGRNVTSLAAATAFYCDALGFEESENDFQESEDLIRLLAPKGEARKIRIKRLKLGTEILELAAFDAPPATAFGGRACDLWFQHFAIVVDDIEQSYRHLKKYPIQSITQTGPQHLPDRAGGVIAYKFRDPDGHPLELIQFPSDSRDEKSKDMPQSPNALRIDHSAISVQDAARSSAFYRDLLGFSVAQAQVNHGIEQDRLDALNGVIVDVVALDPVCASAPHLELLGYRAPQGQRASKASQLDDITADRLYFQVDNLNAVMNKFAAAGISLHSVSLDNGLRAALANDPEGHLLVLIEEANA